ncbi:hypothetical protein [Nitriliruptor alkaliphilus]|uniref:hypothetical protein n=1 Tax=Nitriliruptor alkaliphilus TaxID=427918 RepID=UPI000696EE39|nr:hypothetical protein [Nitriliruptor alkaliphilus]
MRWAGALGLTAAAVLAGAPVAGLPPVGAPPLTVGDLEFSGHDRVAHLDAYEQPMTAVGYVDGAGAYVRVPLAHTGGGGPVTVSAVDPFPELLGMVEVEAVAGLPVTLAAGEEATIVVRTRFTNCRYYTERAVNHFLGAEVTIDAPGGQRDVTLTYPSEVVLRSPTILGCPDRVMDRSARQRLLARDE